MPAPGTNKAPSFKGEAAKLLEFFEFFEDLVSTAGLTDEEKCRQLVRYADADTKHFWVTLEGYDTHDYALLKKTIFDFYPNSTKGKKYTVSHLETLLVRQAEFEITSETELLQYYREFRPIAVWLEARAFITTREKNRYFWQGLHPATRRAITRRLEVSESAWDRKEPLDIDKVVKAGRFVFSDDAFDSE
ncbi:hypothetical protein PLICRDRAFT_134037, partial [Plicaturopsis crispa FD-325 SS-3]